MVGGFNMSGEHGRTRYGNGRHPDLPWGYWLVSKSSVPGEPPLVDEDGKVWRSVREAFWCGRLGLHGYPNHRTLEFIASYLAILDGRFVDKEERVRDVFQADHHIADFFEVFLTSARLIANHRYERVTPEGRAVLAMLIATRNVDDAANAVGMDWIRANRSVAGQHERANAAERVKRAEEVAERMLYRFTTRELGVLPSVSLIGLQVTDEIPLRSTLWSMVWPVADTHARDQFYLWLVERIDRWEYWSAMVKEKGARALTEHFMKLAFCDREISASAVMQEYD